MGLLCRIQSSPSVSIDHSMSCGAPRLVLEPKRQPTEIENTAGRQESLDLCFGVYVRKGGLAPDGQIRAGHDEPSRLESP